MGYLKNKTFGFYLSFVAAILALIGFVMYRQSGHTESYIEVLLLVTVVLQILAMIVLKVAPDFKWTSLLLTANAILTAAAQQHWSSKIIQGTKWRSVIIPMPCLWQDIWEQNLMHVPATGRARKERSRDPSTISKNNS